jgi:hypothetical protein
MKRISLDEKVVNTLTKKGQGNTEPGVFELRELLAKGGWIFKDELRSVGGLHMEFTNDAGFTLKTWLGFPDKPDTF